MIPLKEVFGFSLSLLGPLSRENDGAGRSKKRDANLSRILNKAGFKEFDKFPLVTISGFNRTMCRRM